MVEKQKTPHQIAEEHQAIQRRLREEYYLRHPELNPKPAEPTDSPSPEGEEE